MLQAMPTKGLQDANSPLQRLLHTWMRMRPSADKSTASSMQRNLSRWHRGRAPTQGKQTRPKVLVDQHSDATYDPCQQVCCCCGTSMQLLQLASCYCCWCSPHARLLSDRRRASIECQQVGHPAVDPTSGVLCQQQKTTQLFHLPRHMPWQQGACCSRTGSCSQCYQQQSQSKPSDVDYAALSSAGPFPCNDCKPRP
jgi:hypothetical protein